MSADANNSQERAILMLLPVIVGPFHIAYVYGWLQWLLVGRWHCIRILSSCHAYKHQYFQERGQMDSGGYKARRQESEIGQRTISGIRIIKFYAWEKPFLKMIEKARAYEMDAIARHAYWVQIGMMAAFQSMPQLLQLCVFAAFYYLGGEFKASTVFVTIQLFDVLRIPVAQMPNGLSQVAQLHVALRRIKRFLKRKKLSSSEDTFNNSGKMTDDLPCIVVNSGSFAWRLMEKDKDEAVKGDETSKPQVDNSQNPIAKSKCGKWAILIWLFLLVNWYWLPGLWVVESPAYYGCFWTKSLRLVGREGQWASVLRFSASMDCKRYIEEQHPFGSTYDESHYRRTIRVCGLEPDLNPLRVAINNDRRKYQFIRGQNRVGLARAVYASSSIVLMDSPLAAVVRMLEIIF